MSLNLGRIAHLVRGVTEFERRAKTLQEMTSPSEISYNSAKISLSRIVKATQLLFNKLISNMSYLCMCELSRIFNLKLRMLGEGYKCRFKRIKRTTLKARRHVTGPQSVEGFRICVPRNTNVKRLNKHQTILAVPLTRM